MHLLDHLKISKAHVVGASMGGMIAQLVCVNHPDRVLSLTYVELVVWRIWLVLLEVLSSIMSSTGSRDLSLTPSLRFLCAMVCCRSRPPEEDFEEMVQFVTENICLLSQCADRESLRYCALIVSLLALLFVRYFDGKNPHQTAEYYVSRYPGNAGYTRQVGFVDKVDDLLNHVFSGFGNCSCAVS